MATALRPRPQTLSPISPDDYDPAPIAASDVIDGSLVTRVHHAIQGPGS